ncbi:hypothetical protein P2R99_13380 [Escherichia coli]
MSACDNDKISDHTDFCEEIVTSEQIQFWSMVATFLSAFAAATSAFFTLKTVNSWKKEAKHEAQREFKKAIFHYNVIARILPDRAFSHLRQEKKDDFLAFKKAMSDCSYAWAMTEGSIKNPEVIQAWSQLEQAHYEYMSVRQRITVVQDRAADIIESRFLN